MSRKLTASSSVLSIRVPAELDRRLAATAKRRRQSRSEAARELLEAALTKGAPVADPAVEARRQSRLASKRASEGDVLDFIGTIADLRGWR